MIFAYFLITNPLLVKEQLLPILQEKVLVEDLSLVEVMQKVQHQKRAEAKNGIQMSLMILENLSEQQVLLHNRYSEILIQEEKVY